MMSGAYLMVSLLKRRRRNHSKQRSALSFFPWLFQVILICCSWILSAHATGNNVINDNNSRNGRLRCDPNHSNLFVCARHVHASSVCDPVTRYCTNPYAAEGCLAVHAVGSQNNSTKAVVPRACNSNDASSSSSSFSCRSTPYDELRIHHAPDGRDSSLIVAWISQIVLSERLGVPVTIVSGNTTNSEAAQWSFYSPDNSWVDYDLHEETDDDDDDDDDDDPTVQQQQQLDIPVICPPQTQQQSQEQGETNCVHVVPEVWGTSTSFTASSIISRPLEYRGSATWYIPKWTAQQLHRLLLRTFLGGNHTTTTTTSLRAVSFPQPFTWRYYCQVISTTNCQQPDAVAQRAPASTYEAFSFFVHGSYTGYFDQNNLNTKFGHAIAPSLCDSYFGDILHNNNDRVHHLLDDGGLLPLHLQSQGPLAPNGGYTRQHMQQIWRAANATQSHVVMFWSTPDAFAQVFRGSDYEFVPLPSVLFWNSTTNDDDDGKSRQQSSYECVNWKTKQWQKPSMVESSNDTHCNNNNNHDPTMIPLQQIISSSLRDEVFANSNPVDRNLAYETLRNIRITQDDMDHILQQWGRAQMMQQTDSFGYEARQAVCAWVADHLEQLDASIPEGYPLHFPSDGDDEWQENPSYLVAAQAVGGVTSLLVLVVAIFFVWKRRHLVIIYAQFHFVLSVLVGFWFLSMAAIVYGKEPTDTRCLLGQWLVSLGFTLVLVPLLVKMATLNYIALSSLGKHRRADADAGRISISPVKMFLVETAMIIAVVMYLMVWTERSPTRRVETRILHVIENDGSQYVEERISCSSDSDGWIIAFMCWQGTLLVSATAISILTYQILEDFKETKQLGLLIYFQDVFFVACVVLFLKRDGIQPSAYSAWLSYLLSFDGMISLGIYFVPILWHVASNPGVSLQAGHSHNNAGSGQETQGRRASVLPNDNLPDGNRTALFGTNLNQLSLGLDSAASIDDITTRIRAHMSISQATGDRRHGFAAGSGASSVEPEEPMTAECRHSHVASNTSEQQI